MLHPDSRRIRSWIADRQARTAVVVGGGFIGGGAAVSDGCVLEKRLVRGAPKFVKVCPTF